jgi:hypothetical protein
VAGLQSASQVATPVGRKNTVPVHEWGDAGCSRLATTWDAQVGRGDTGVLHRGCEGAARENTAGRVMLRAYRRGAGHRLQGLRRSFRISAETETEVLLDRAVPVVRSIYVAARGGHRSQAQHSTICWAAHSAAG